VTDLVSVFELRDVEQRSGGRSERLLAEDAHQELAVLDEDARVARRNPVVRAVVLLRTRF
jgi:hypothetical protein